MAPASVQYVKVKPAVDPAEIADAVKSAVEGEQTEAGLVMTKFGVRFIVIVAVADCENEQPADEETLPNE